MTTVNIEQWLDGISVVEEDHVFTPVGSQSEKMTELLNRRANLMADFTQKTDEEGLVPEEERSLADSYTDVRDALDRDIAKQLELDHPDAMRARLRGLSDEDIEEIANELVEIRVEGKPLDANKMRVENALRLVSRSFVQPQMSVQDIRLLRRRLNQGEWARLLDHVMRLASSQSEAVDVPNS